MLRFGKPSITVAPLFRKRQIAYRELIIGNSSMCVSRSMLGSPVSQISRGVLSCSGNSDSSIRMGIMSIISSPDGS